MISFVLSARWIVAAHITIHPHPIIVAACSLAGLLAAAAAIATAEHNNINFPIYVYFSTNCLPAAVWLDCTELIIECENAANSHLSQGITANCHNSSFRTNEMWPDCWAFLPRRFALDPLRLQFRHTHAHRIALVSMSPLFVARINAFIRASQQRITISTHSIPSWRKIRKNTQKNLHYEWVMATSNSIIIEKPTKTKKRERKSYSTHIMYIVYGIEFVFLETSHNPYDVSLYIIIILHLYEWWLVFTPFPNSLFSTAIIVRYTPFHFQQLWQKQS